MPTAAKTHRQKINGADNAKQMVLVQKKKRSLWSNDAFYSSTTWRKFRAWYIRRFPVCVACHAPAEHVDHIVPLKKGGKKYALENLQPLCVSCHSKKTAAENR